LFPLSKVSQKALKYPRPLTAPQKIDQPDLSGKNFILAPKWQAGPLPRIFAAISAIAEAARFSTCILKKIPEKADKNHAVS
jgi:hypothetical protein